jgi:hypothetical protein
MHIFELVLLLCDHFLQVRHLGLQILGFKVEPLPLFLGLFDPGSKVIVSLLALIPLTVDLVFECLNRLFHLILFVVLHLEGHLQIGDFLLILVLVVILVTARGDFKFLQLTCVISLEVVDCFVVALSQILNTSL